MFPKIAKNLTDHLVLNQVIPESDSEVYSFGFEVGFSMIVNLVLSFVIGFFIGMPLEGLLLLAVFIPLRSFAGGFHASNQFRCLWLSVLAVGAVLLFARFAASVLTPMPIMLIGVISAVIIAVLSPVSDTNKPLDKIEIQTLKKRTRIALCVNLLVLLLLLLFGFAAASLVSALTLLMVCLSLCFGAVKNLLAKSC